jgi:hypothetical protein
MAIGNDMCTDAVRQLFVRKIIQMTLMHKNEGRNTSDQCVFVREILDDSQKIASSLVDRLFNQAARIQYLQHIYNIN